MNKKLGYAFKNLDDVIFPFNFSQQRGDGGGVESGYDTSSIGSQVKLRSPAQSLEHVPYLLGHFSNGDGHTFIEALLQ